MAEKVIMLGNEAIARGAYEAGVKVSSAYPGTPSTEISEYLVQYRDEVYFVHFLVAHIMFPPVIPDCCMMSPALYYDRLTRL